MSHAVLSTSAVQAAQPSGFITPNNKTWLGGKEHTEINKESQQVGGGGRSHWCCPSVTVGTARSRPVCVMSWEFLFTYDNV
jgi:hypothetical protein